MEIAPIKNRQDYLRTLKDIEGLMNAKRNKTDGNRLDALVALVDTSERNHRPLDRASRL